VEPFYFLGDETPEIIFVVNDQVIIESTASELESKKTTQHYFSRIGYNASVVTHTIMISKTAYPTFQGKAYRMSSINGPSHHPVWGVECYIGDGAAKHCGHTEGI